MKNLIYILLMICGISFSACNDSLKIVVPDRTPDFTGEIESDFTPEQLKLPGKKGVCFTLREDQKELNLARGKSLRAFWNYRWGPERVAEQPEEMEFVPMIWGKASIESKLEPVREQIQAGYGKRLFGFNEPDGEKQANMTVDEAIALWPQMMSLGIPLGSPAVVGTDKDKWLEKFMGKVEELGYRVDYICVHNYGGGNAETFKQNMIDIFGKYNRPLIITEFAVADFTANTPSENRHNPAKILQFMKDVLPWLEETEFIYGYAWFSYGYDSPVGCTSALFDASGRLTELGRFYQEFTPNEALEPMEPPVEEVEPNDPPVEGGNLLLSPGFEDEDAKKNWGNRTTNVALDNKATNPEQASAIISGDVTLRLSGKKSWADVVQSVKVEKGKTYEFGFTGRAQEAVGPSGSPSNNRRVTMNVRKDKDNVYASVEVTVGTNTTVSGTVTITDDMPETVQIQISKVNGIAYVDDVFFKEK